MCQQNSHTACHKSLTHVRASTPDKLTSSLPTQPKERKKTGHTKISENFKAYKHKTHTICDRDNRSNKCREEERIEEIYTVHNSKAQKRL